ncbi:hypothetical protein DFA_01741 [Cavenderia fasciculata]|uniref:Armadillo repeat-containing protein n=1 Tax=Cavenderia fasciculata TaxID=261658 RepID=F4PUJ1_CACFS|nr:uncharacterized protein DFA_01741 [Cavenderia fasciculata]EGG21855.1 hypothetical protein DFA_01741 [Cavenderia fasciculata]|eukprot:XP_004359706.1 hypothetical protein DFA_01741 [Cavenderia fasciculata]
MIILYCDHHHHHQSAVYDDDDCANKQTLVDNISVLKLYSMSWFGGFLGGNARETIMRGVGAVANVDRTSNINAEGLLDKVALETLPADERKQALNQLTAVGKNGFQAVGSKMSVLTAFLKKYKDDIEVVRDVVETLTCVMTCHPKDDNIIQIHNTELFLNDKETFVLLCDLLTLHDYYVRYYIARFLKVVLDNRFESVQELILSCPMSVPNIVLLLSDTREVVRNEIILVLYNLTKSNQEIQKIVAFEGAFDVLLDIINKEGQSEGGIIVNDCIQTLINLLKSNVSNQNYFRETGCIPRVAPLLQVQNTDMWILSDNKFNIIMSSLELILTLVERNNISTPLNQNQISQSGGAGAVGDQACRPARRPDGACRLAQAARRVVGPRTQGSTRAAL